MNAVEKGAKFGERFRLDRPVHFEGMTVDQYRIYGRTVAKQYYTSLAKQNEFMSGWFAINRQFFCLMKDGPRRRILEVKLWCERCGGFETVELKQGESVASLRRRGLVCQSWAVTSPFRCVRRIVLESSQVYRWEKIMNQFDPLKMGVSFEQFRKALQDMAPAMDKAWQQVGGDEMVWKRRIDGPAYRQTPVLGRFRWYRRLRAWWLRRQLGI